MKWNQLTRRELEISFDTGTKVYYIDRKPTAAKVVTNFTTTVACTKRELSEDEKRLVKNWMNCEPNVIKYITDQQLEHIVNNEDKRKNVKSP